MDKYCQNCNQANPADAFFCRNCSATLPQNQSGGQQQQQGNPQWNQPNAGNQPQFNAPNFGNQPVSAASPAAGASQKATIALVLAIAGFFCCGPIAAIPAAIVGWMEVGAIKRGESPRSGMVMAQIGLWGGIVITVIQSILFILYILFAVMVETSNPYGY